MPRFACLWVPDLPVAALVRIEPDLGGVPLALAAGRTPRSLITTVSAAAASAGVHAGMTTAQARAVSSEVVVRPMSPGAMHAAAEALADVAATVTPNVEVDANGTVFLDCAGSAALCASESELAAILTGRAAHQGLAIHVGIGGSKLAARIAARETDGVRIVASDQTRAFLAPLPVTLLDPDPESSATLRSWGITRIGELATLPGGAVAHRLGVAGTALVRRARGDDENLLHCRPSPTAFTEAVELEYPVDRIEPLLFASRRLLDHMTARFALHGYACERLELALELDGGGHDLRTITPAAPTAESKVLLTLVRTDVEHRPPPQAVVAITIHGIPSRLRTTQLDFFRPAGPAPAALAATIARLAALCGPDRVGTPVPPTSHRPEAYTMAAFGTAATATVTNGTRGERPAVAAAAADARGDGPTEEIDTTPAHANERVVTRIALRAFRPPMPLEVFTGARGLDYVRGPGLGGRVVHVAGPWRLRGEWWTADPCAREYYDVELSDGGVYRIYRDLRRDCWLADGTYD